MFVVEPDGCAVTFEEFVLHQGGSLRRPALEAIAREAVDEARSLIQPVIAYDWLPVEMAGEGPVRVGQRSLQLGFYAKFMADAREAAVAVFSIGAALEGRVSRLLRDGETAKAYLLDEVGIRSVLEVSRRFNAIVEQEAATRQWGVGVELAPGRVNGWNLAEQRLLCSLLDIGAIGVSMTDAGMLIPQKSASVMIGIGPDYAAAQVRSPCDSCARRPTCKWRDYYRDKPVGG